MCATWYGEDSPHLPWKCAQVTGKAGENGQHSGEMGGSSPWTRPSAPECGDTQGSSGRPASDLGWGSSSKTALGSLSTGSPAGRTPPHGDGSMHSQANVRAGKVLRPPLRALPPVIVVTRKVLREADGPFEMSALTLPSGGRFAPGFASKAVGCVGEEPEEHK